MPPTVGADALGRWPDTLNVEQVAGLADGDHSNLHVLYGQDLGRVLQIVEAPFFAAAGHGDLDRHFLQAAPVDQREDALAADLDAALRATSLTSV